MAITCRVRFAERSFDLVSVVGPPLFDPRDHGIEVVRGFSLCPAGFYGIYDLEPRLTLRRLHVRLTDDAPATPLDGVVPVRRLRRTQRLVDGRWTAGDWPTWDHVYRGLALPMGFTGSLGLGADRLGSADPSEPLLAYRTVWDVLVEDGRLAAAIDRSSEVAGARARRRRAEPGHGAAIFDALH